LSVSLAVATLAGYKPAPARWWPWSRRWAGNTWLIVVILPSGHA